MPSFTISVTVRHHDCERTTSGTVSAAMAHNVSAAIDHFIRIYKLHNRHPSDDVDVPAPVISLITAFRTYDGAA
jgi:hypothetical protein